MINIGFYSKIGGEGGIRTLDTLLAYTHFPGVLLQPLGHLTMWGYNSFVSVWKTSLTV